MGGFMGASRADVLGAFFLHMQPFLFLKVVVKCARQEPFYQY